MNNTIKRISTVVVSAIAATFLVAVPQAQAAVSKNISGVYAAGSGAPYALGALHAGADAYEAMEIAAKLTAFTAGPYLSKTQFKHSK